MSTEALIKTYLNYPLKSHVFNFDSANIGFNSLKDHHNLGLNTLLQRSDLAETLTAIYADIPVISTEIDEASPLYEVSRDNLWKMAYLEVLAAQITFDENNSSHNALLDLLDEKITAKQANADFYSFSASLFYELLSEKLGVDPAFYEVYLSTPLGSSVLAYYMEESDEWQPASRLDELEEQQLDEFNLNEDDLLQAASARYNCHSYAWHSQASNNHYWVWGVDAYMEDGSYRQITTPQIGAKVFYYTTDTPSGQARDNHSGIVISTNPLKFASKWGPGGVYRHTPENCPYYYSSSETFLTYWVPAT